MHLPVSELDAAADFQVRILDCRLVLGPFSLALQQREHSAVITYSIGSKTSYETHQHSQTHVTVPILVLTRV